MKKAIIILLCCFCFKAFSQAIELSEQAEVSIITVGPGDQLFEAFGHSAIRVKDPVYQIDIAYNYGLFDFNQPNFYLNFAKGKLLYKLGKHAFSKFVQSNAYYKRWMIEQVLNLNQQEKQHIFTFLENNAKPENASYLYDPFFENCATKPRDLVLLTLDNKITLNTNFVTKNETLRSLMNKELPQNTWGGFGINLALGNKLDKKITLSEYLYLPDYVYKSFKGAFINDKSVDRPLVKEEKILLNYEEKKIESSVLSPLLVFSVLFLLVLFITIRDFNQKQLTKWIDVSLFVFTGSTGCVILFLWFFTDHTTTPNNFNALWCFPLNLLFVFMIFKKDTIMKRYFLLLLLLILSVVVSWLLHFQSFNYVTIPLLLSLVLRYSMNLLTFKREYGR